MSTAVITFGRMNPVTTGHELLVNKVKDIASMIDADPLIYLSHRQDSITNPLPYLSKLFIARAAFGNCVQLTDANTIIKVMQQIDEEYDNVMFVCGSDRVDEFDELLHKYNGKEYHYKSIMVVSAGQRDPDDDTVAGMSATKMRQAATHGAINTFESGLPDSIKYMSHIIMNDVRKGLKGK